MVVVRGHGAAPHTTVIRSINVSGATVPSGPMTVNVDGDPTTVTFNSWGLGEITFDVPGIHTIEDSDGDAVIYATNRNWRGFGLPIAVDAQLTATGATHAAFGDLVWGLAATGASRLIWIPTGGTAHPILTVNAGDPIRDVRVAHLDNDGMLDAVAWNGTAVFLLRGVPESGLVYAGVLEAADHAIAGVDVGVATIDEFPDVAVAWTNNGNGVVQVFHGDGLWDFSTSTRIDLLAEPVSLSLDDATNTGRDQLTVLQEGRWQRFLMLSSGSWAEVGPELPIEVTAGTTFGEGGDANGDGAEELLLKSPLTVGTDRSVTVLDLFGADIEYLYRVLPMATVGYADGTGDGNLDVWMRPQGGSLSVMAWVLSSALAWDLGTLPDEGPFTIGDTINTDIPAFFLAGLDSWSWHSGVLGEEVWRFTDPVTTEVADKTEAFAALHQDEDPDHVYFVAAQDRFDTTWLRKWQISRTTNDRVMLQEVPIASIDAEILDLQVCEDTIVIATSEGLAVVDRSVEPWGVHTQADLLATRVACADLLAPGIPDVDIGEKVAAVLSTDIVTWIDRNGDTITSEQALGAVDLAVKLVDGAVVMSTCQSPGCAIDVWLPDDRPEFVISDGEAVAFESGSSAELSGWLIINDVDNDGHDDLVGVQDDGQVTVLLTVTGDAGPRVRFHSMPTVGRWSAIEDLDGDGVKDLWSVDSNREIRVSGPVDVNEFEFPDTGSDTASNTGSDTDSDLDTDPNARADTDTDAKSAETADTSK